MFIKIVHAIWNSSWATNTIFSSKMEFWDFVLMVITLIVLFAWIFSIIYILWGGVLLILSWWKDDKIRPAINSIRYSLIGFIIIVLSVFIFPKLAWLLWLDVSKYSSPDKIFREIKILWDKILWNNTYNNIDLDVKKTDSLPSDFSDL